MNRRKAIIPRLAVMGIRKNASTYLPYIGVSIFAVFTYFVFDLILKNDIMTTIPKAVYAMVLMSIGFTLLGIIMVPFLYYTNSFLIKRRKKELGLYSILGMEKKHIGMMMLCETGLIYVIVTAAAILLGLLFSKLLFLLLLNLAHLPVQASFAVSGKAIRDTFLFYGFISLLNLFVNLVQVGKANPAELMSESKKGEKEPKHIVIWTVLGLLIMGAGYYLAIGARIDSMIFINFFLAVFLVVVGTHMLFTSGSISFLRILKRSRKFYYRPDNFITVSGMLYRMKKSAASLVNICIFATMAIITVMCTVALYLGMDGIVSFRYPFDMEARFLYDDFTDRENWESEVYRLAEESGRRITAYQQYSYVQLSIVREGTSVTMERKEDNYENWYTMKFMTVEELNALDGTSYELEPGEILIYSTGENYGKTVIDFMGHSYSVKEELRKSNIGPKSENNTFGGEYAVIVSGEEEMAEIVSFLGAEGTVRSFLSQIDVDGSSEEKMQFFEKLSALAEGKQGYAMAQQFGERTEEQISMYGGLLFIGIFFGLIFAICLLIIMYYKQITEGFEDQKNFDIMQKVGMSDREVKHTIRKQILLVFFLPVAGAFCHTAVALKMVIKLMACIGMFDSTLIIVCAGIVCLIFAVIYSVCYHCTAKTYYQIVRKMAA